MLLRPYARSVRRHRVGRPGPLTALLGLPCLQILLSRRDQVEREWLELLRAFDARFSTQRGLARVSSQLIMRSPRTDRSVAL